MTAATLNANNLPEVQVLPESWRKIVEAARTHFKGNALVQRIAEFGNEQPMRASANLNVAWDDKKSFALVNQFMHSTSKAVLQFGAKLGGTGARGLKVVQNIGNKPAAPKGPTTF